VQSVPPPKIEEGTYIFYSLCVRLREGLSEEAFKMLVTNIEHDAYLGRLVSGKITSGTLRPGDPVKALALDGKGNVPETKAFNFVISHTFLVYKALT
jgi:predicted membrane GTPase involved in stress response